MTKYDKGLIFNGGEEEIITVFRSLFTNNKFLYAVHIFKFHTSPIYSSYLPLPEYIYPGCNYNVKRTVITNVVS